MKKHFLFLLIAFLLAIPFTASADPLGDGILYVTWDSPVVVYNNYYLDYDGEIEGSTAPGIENGLYEYIFCVSPDHANWREEVEFYSISSLATDLSNYASSLSQAAWIADNFKTYGNAYDAQIAIWAVVGVVPTMQANYYYNNTAYSTANAAALLAASNGHTDYITDNWAVAISGTYAETGYQDYLVPMNPVPEPATMLLLGAGLIGLGGLRRKFKK